MGHVRLKAPPVGRFWDQVVEHLEDGAPVDDVAAAATTAADSALEAAASDPGFGHVVRLLIELPIAARNAALRDRLDRHGIQTPSPPSLMDLLAGVDLSAEAEARRAGGRTDLGEMARLAAVASLTSAIARELPSLFGASAADVETAIGALGTEERFAQLSRAFFADLTHRSLEYYLSRTYADHVGPAERFASLNDKEAFQRALQARCYEAAHVVEAHSRRWFLEHASDNSISLEDAGRFARDAFGELRAELSHQRQSDG